MKDNSYCEVIKYLSCFVCALSEAKGMIKFMRIGIDIGGMTVKIGLVEEEIYRITDKKVIPTDSEKQSAEALVGRIVMVIQELLGENNIALTECKAIGIACPGMVDSRLGTVLYSNNLGWEDIALLDMLEQEIPIPMEIANDADTAALGEEEGSCRLQKSGCVGWEKPG